MSKRTNRQYYDDEDESNLYKTHKGKHAKHAHNLKGKGMRVINSYAVDELEEEDDFDDFEDYYSDTKTQFYISTTR